MNQINLFLHTTPSTASSAVGSALQKYFTVATELSPDCELFVAAFPEPVHADSAADSVLNSTFTAAQQFVTYRMKKKYGQLLFLVSAEANGLYYRDIPAEHRLSLMMQGGLVGLAKTITKEYNKKNVFANALFVDWSVVDMDFLAGFVFNTCIPNSQIKGQVFAIDNGKWL